MTAMRPARPPADAESITDRLDRIGSVAGDAEGGYSAFDSDDRLIEVFETRPAARKAVYDRHRGEDRP